MDSTQTKSNPAITSGKTPENMEAPLNKTQNGNGALHTQQSNREEVREITGDKTKESPYSNPNIQNYLGSEKMDEKLSNQTEKFQNDMRNSEKNINGNINESPDLDSTAEDEENKEGTMNNPKIPMKSEKGSGGGNNSSNKDADRPEIRYDSEEDW